MDIEAPCKFWGKKHSGTVYISIYIYASKKHLFCISIYIYIGLIIWSNNEHNDNSCQCSSSRIQSDSPLLDNNLKCCHLRLLWFIFPIKCSVSFSKAIYLVVEPTHLKNISQIGSFPQVGMNIKTCLKPPPGYIQITDGYKPKNLWLLLCSDKNSVALLAETKTNLNLASL